jgi:hypothetical protein
MCYNIYRKKEREIITMKATKNFYYHLVNVNTYELIGVECDCLDTVYEENNLDRNEWKTTAFFDLRGVR